MISSLSRFGTSLPAYSTNSASSPTTENSKALGVSSRANTQRQGFSIFTLATMAYATGKKNYEVGMQAPIIGTTLNSILDGHQVLGSTDLYTVSTNKLGDIVLYLNKNFESVFSNAKTNPVDVLQSWLGVKGKQRISPIEEETLSAYIEDCKFYADLLGNTDKLDTWVAQMRSKAQNAVLSKTEQRRWDSYLTYQNLEYLSSEASYQRAARGLLFKNLLPKLEGLLNAVQPTS